jgi:diguanylate cyclase (GGDEF)-like protein
MPQSASEATPARGTGSPSTDPELGSEEVGAQLGSPGFGSQLDVLAVVRATQTFSAELDLDRLVATMLELLVEHAGAERGCLLLTPGGEARLAAEAVVHPSGITVTLALGLPSELHLPMTVLDYVRQTRRAVVVGDPQGLRRFSSDPYLRGDLPLSLACLPMTHRGQLVALLYLEHRHLADAFTPAHVALLEVLSFQAAISLENARIYTDLDDAFERLRHKALHDELTDLANRALLLEHLRVALALAHRGDSSLAVFCLGLDNFKVVNDSLGHEAGDTLLIEVAHRLRSVLRETDTAARLSGDEFAILCVDIADERQPHQIAARLATELAMPFHVGGTELRVTASIGIVLPTNLSDGPEQLLRDADLAMYRAKQQGKNRFEFFNEIHRVRVVDRLRMESELRHGLAHDELRVYYQPVFRLSDFAIVGFEALVRWEHPARGLLMPSNFLEVAEESDLVVEIGLRVLTEACNQAVAWQKMGVAPPTMAVNLSLRQLYKGDFPQRLAGILSETGLDPRLLMLEVTESLLFDANVSATADLVAVKDMGVQLGIDDFGTGYSSLSYLKRLPVTFIKVDRSFVNGLGDNAEDSAIVEAVIRLGQALDLDTIAEGVETGEQLVELMTLGCTYGQGFYVSKALPAESAELLLLTGGRGP